MANYVLAYNHWHCVVEDVPSLSRTDEKYHALCRFIYFLDKLEPPIVLEQANALLTAFHKRANSREFTHDPCIAPLIAQSQSSQYPNFVTDYEIITKKTFPGISDSAYIAIAYIRNKTETKFFITLNEQLKAASENFASGLPEPMRNRVILNDNIVNFILTEFNNFLKFVKQRWSWNNYGRYKNKNSEEHLLVQDKRAFLIYTKSEVPHTFFIIIKSQTKILGAPESESGIMFGKGRTKAIKINGILITIFSSPFVLKNFQIDPIVTLTQKSTPSVRAFPYTSHQFERKTYDLLTELDYPNAMFDFYGWEFVIFKNPPLFMEDRTIGYLKKVGTHECSYPFIFLLGWTPLQKVHAICCILTEVLNSLLKGTWPGDLKFPNMRRDESIFGFPKLFLIDNVGNNTTYSLYKSIGMNIPPGIDNRNPIISSFSLENYRIALNRLNKRNPIEEVVFQRLIYQLFFEILYNVFFILNPNLIEDNYETNESWGWNLPPIPEAKMQAYGEIPQAPQQPYLPFKDLLIKYTFHQNFDQSILQIVLAFIGAVQIELNRIIQTAIEAGEMPPHDMINPTGLINPTFAGSPLNPAWLPKFLHAVENFRTTPSPFKPIKIRSLTMI